MSLFKRASVGAVTTAVLAATLMTVMPQTASAAESNGGTRVMPLGDSITQGGGAYRTRLWQNLQAGGYTVDFVGSASGGPTELGDRDHEGHSGWRIAQIDSQIAGWVAATNPRTVLLHIGTNDVGQNDNLSQAPARLSALIDKIRTGAPNADVFVASIIPFADPVANARAQTYNDAIPGVVASKGSKVHFVDMHSALTTADLSDGVHPNAAGNVKMGDVWYGALRSVPGSIGSPSGIGVPQNYRLGNTNLCLDVYGATSAPLTRTVAWGCHGNANQKWTRTAAGELRVYGNNCLDVYGGVTAAGSRVVIYPCHGYNNQGWTLRADGTLLNARSGRCAAAKDGSTAQGVEIVLADCTSAQTMRWTAY
jgi:lysophospholipase L1-like esterase